MLVAETEDASSSGRSDVFKFFVREFRDVMDDPKSRMKEISTAVRGYGYFAAVSHVLSTAELFCPLKPVLKLHNVFVFLSQPCRKFLSNDDVKFMFNELVQRSEQVFFTGDSSSLEDRLMNLPSFLEALASIAKHLDGVRITKSPNVLRTCL